MLPWFLYQSLDKMQVTQYISDIIGGISFGEWKLT